MGMVSSDIRDRTVKLEGLSLNEATAPPAEDMLEQEMFEVDEVTAGLGVGKEGALSSGHGSSDSEDWNHLIEVESRRMEGAVAKYQPSIYSGTMERRVPSLPSSTAGEDYTAGIHYNGGSTGLP